MHLSFQYFETNHRLKVHTSLFLNGFYLIDLSVSEFVY